MLLCIGFMNLLCRGRLPETPVQVYLPIWSASTPKVKTSLSHFYQPVLATIKGTEPGLDLDLTTMLRIPRPGWMAPQSLIPTGLMESQIIIMVMKGALRWIGMEEVCGMIMIAMRRSSISVKKFGLCNGSLLEC